MNCNKFYRNQDIVDLICADIWEITCEQGGIFGMYGATREEADGKHSGTGVIERVRTDTIPGYEKYTLRIYVLSVECGGICIIGTEDGNYKILQLSEDDGYFFVSRENEFERMNKSDFLDITCRAISLLNNRNG